jgi:predicted RNA-binding protein with PUA-like domain
VTPVTLKRMKADPELADMALIRQSRLSVCPVTDRQWDHICRLAGIAESVDDGYALPA